MKREGRGVGVKPLGLHGEGDNRNGVLERVVMQPCSPPCNSQHSQLADRVTSLCPLGPLSVTCLPISAGHIAQTGLQTSRSKTAWTRNLPQCSVSCLIAADVLIRRGPLLTSWLGEDHCWRTDEARTTSDVLTWRGPLLTYWLGEYHCWRTD